MTEEVEIEDYQDKYLRLLAEMENTRKRFAREREEAVKHAVADTVVGLLQPLDQLEGALEHAEGAAPEVQNWAIGFRMILQQFKDRLTEQNVVAFDALGEVFDPHHHEAIELVESEEHPPGTIIEQEVRGYKMGERTIRAARVKVTKEPAEEKENDAEEE